MPIIRIYLTPCILEYSSTCMDTRLLTLSSPCCARRMYCTRPVLLTLWAGKKFPHKHPARRSRPWHPLLMNKARRRKEEGLRALRWFHDGPPRCQKTDPASLRRVPVGKPILSQRDKLFQRRDYVTDSHPRPRGRSAAVQPHTTAEQGDREVEVLRSSLSIPRLRSVGRSYAS